MISGKRILLSNLLRMQKLSSQVVRSTTASGSNVYESKRAVDEYLLFHFGDRENLMPYEFGPVSALSFPKRCAQICNEFTYGSKRTRALDLGCSVGGCTFELSKYFNEVIGIDFSNHFISAANELKEVKRMKYDIQVQGDRMKSCEVVLDSSIDARNIHFFQGDACNLDASLGRFDVILGSNLLCRLPEPKKFLLEVSNFLNANGCLVLVSPYSWLEEYTEKSNWIGAKQGIDSFDELQTILNNGHKPLKLIHRQNVPFLIREHERKFQYGVSDCTIWSRE